MLLLFQKHIQPAAGFANTRILRQNCSDDSTEVTEGVTLTSEIFGYKQGATSTPEIFGNTHSFVPVSYTHLTLPTSDLV